MNENVAQIDDEKLVPEGEARPRVRGQGAWKRMLPTAMLRRVFGKPCDTVRAEARACNRAASYVLSMKFMGADVLTGKQEIAIADKLQEIRTTGGFAIFTLMWDYSQIWLSPGVEGECRGMDCSILIAHGFLTYARRTGDDLEVGEDEVVLRPCHTMSCTAADTWAGLKAIVPPALWDAVFQNPTPPNMIIGINTAGDHASTNKIIMTHIDNIAHENVIAFNAHCKSHATALCISPCVKRCNLLPPAFCLAKQFRKESVVLKFWAGVRASLLKNLVLVRETEEPDWQPCPADMAHASAMLELTYYRHDLRSTSPSVAAACAEIDKLRRSRGTKLIEQCPGDWRRRTVVYWARAADEIQTKADAVNWVISHLQAMGYVALGLVSESKWVSAYQMICDLAFAGAFHRLLVDGLRLALGVANLTDEESMSSMSDSRRLGFPSGSKAWHEEENRRAWKAWRWIENPETMPTNLIFLHAAGIVMRSHWHFFKRGHIPPRGETRSFLFDLCDITNSLGAGILKDLDTLIRDGELWGSVLRSAGPFATCPGCRIQIARDVCIMLYGQTMRRLVRCFMTPPLCFVPMADPKLAQDAKRRLAERLFSMSDDELPDCMQRVRLLSGSVDAIMGDFWQSFLFHQWNKLPLTTQFLECLFAAFKNWRLRVPHAMTTALLAAKHTCHEFQRACSRKRNFNAMLGEPGARTKQARPKWIMKRGDHGRWNRFHMHVRECIRARPCGQSARAAFASAAASYDPRAPGPIMQAQVANTLQKQRKRDAMQQVLPERCGDKSVWDLGDDAYPLKASFMEFANRSHTSRMEHTERWKAHNVKRDPDPDFPDSVYHQHVLSADQAAMSTEERKTVQSIVDELGIVFANRSQKVHRTSPVLVTMASGHNVLVTCCSCSKN